MLDPRMRLAGSPLLPGAVLSVGGPGPDYHPARRAAAGTLHVIAGLDAGFGVALRPGRYFIGRAAESHVCLYNQDVSRMHAVVEVSAGGTALITDAGSRNGTWVNGAEVTVPTGLDHASVVWIGKDTLRWVAGTGQALRVVQTADGLLEFDRVFAAAPAIPVRELDGPPAEPTPRNFAAVATSGVLGLATGPALFAGTHDRTMLFASLAGPVASFVTYAIEGCGRRKEKRTVTRARAAAREQLAALAEEETRVRHLLAPGPAEITAMAAGARPDLWPRDARSGHGLVLRVGVTDQAPSVRLRGAPGGDVTVPTLRGVPVTIDLRETGVLGVVGTGEPARALLRWLVVQLATLRSPDDVRLALLTSGVAWDGRDGCGAGDADLRWARWLPHLDGGSAMETPCLIGNTDVSRAARIGELRQLITARMAEPGDSAPASSGVGFRRDVVVVIDGALALRNLPGIRDILLLGPEAGVYVVCADSRGMAECRGVCELAADGLRLIRTPDSAPVTGVADGMDQAQAEQVARALSPMRDRMPAAVAAIPYPVWLLDLLGIGVPSAADILALWSGKRQGPTTRVVLGADASGPVTVDLAAQGPHTMVGGATGAGKSALLQTLVTALLLANRPDELNLVLVDFKGGGAFLPFENCPHVTALIRSTGETVADTFTKADAARVLAFVRAEISRREAILSRYGAEIDNYWRARELQPALPRLPRVVMIFDEFARALDVSQDFLKELVNVAAKGRSLGVHLVLATQSLQGKLSPELKNNIDLRISLRQNEPADSVEVLGAPDAVAIPGSLRGRGMILFTKGEPRTPRPFQSGYLGDPPPAAGGSRLAARTMGWADVGVARPAPVTQGSEGATDQALVISAIEEAARHIRVTAPPTWWPA